MAEKRSSADSEKISEPTEAELANILMTGADRKNKVKRPCEERLEFRSDRSRRIKAVGGWKIDVVLPKVNMELLDLRFEVGCFYGVLCLSLPRGILRTGDVSTRPPVTFLRNSRLGQIWPPQHSTAQHSTP